MQSTLLPPTLPARQRRAWCRGGAAARAPAAAAAAAAAASPEPPEPPLVVVVGGGWGGWGAAKALVEAGVRVTLLDAGRDPTGATPFLTPSGKPMEAGVRGFWRDYPNTDALIDELGIRGAALTPARPSAFWSPHGLEATAPVFGSSPFGRLPSPLGQVFASASLFTRLPLADRASAAGLLLALADFERDEATFVRYDAMSADELFRAAGCSARLVDDFLRPTLAVGLFAPLELTSAAVCLELLYFYAFAHSDSFDVRWVAAGSVASALVAPLAAKLAAARGAGGAPLLTVVAGARATRVDVDPATGALGAVHYRQASAPDPAAAPSSPLVAGASGLVLALGASGLRPLLAASPGLAAAAPSLCSAAAEPSIDVLSLRLWLDRRVSLPQPANVLSRFPDLAALAGPNAGATFFSLDDLQAEGGTCARGMRRLWGHDPGDGSVDASALGSVIACDVYWAGPLLPQPDAAIVALFLDRLLPACVPALRSARLLDSCVLRCPAAVTHFRPGSFGARPATSPAPAAAPWLAAAGDWARLGAAREHGAKGLCQERALVTGLEAGNALLRSGALRTPRGAPAAAALPYPLHPVRPVRDAEPQVVAARAAARAAAALAAAIRPGWWGPPPPSSSP